jgi:FHS family L-fucose permease-like MFS transporter
MLMATSFFMSIQFPTIFTTSLRGLVITKSGSSFLVMAIVGGAVIPCDGTGVRCQQHQYRHADPALCFAVVFLFALKSRRDGVTAPALTAVA